MLSKTCFFCYIKNGDNMWHLILFIIFFAFLGTMYYVIRTILKLDIIKKIKVYSIAKVLFIIFISSLLLFYYDLYNYIIIIIHLAIFILISNFLLYLYKRIIKKDFKTNNIKVVMGLIITIIYLGIGTYLNYHIVETHYTVYNDKDVNLKLIMFADSHVGSTFDGEGFYQKMKDMSNIESDFVFIIGDYIDDGTSKEDMIRACEGLSLLKPKYGVYYVFGNHDRGYYNNRGYSGDDLVDELKKNNVHVLKDEVVTFDNFYLIGREDRSKKRKSIDELVNGLDDRYKIVLNHQPNDYDNEQDKVDLVLSGHTHGGQMLPLGLVGTISGSNDQEQGLEKRGNTNFIVTSGISDWVVQFKTGTKSEYVIIDIKNK